MKKLLKKFKNWLIYKLGGYVERTHVVEHHTVTPILLFSTIHNIDRKEYSDDEKYKEYAEKNLISMLADYLYENREQLIDFRQSGPDINTRWDSVMDLKAVIRVCPVPKKEKLN